MPLDLRTGSWRRSSGDGRMPSGGESDLDRTGSLLIARLYLSGGEVGDSGGEVPVFDAPRRKICIVSVVLETVRNVDAMLKDML